MKRFKSFSSFGAFFCSLNVIIIYEFHFFWWFFIFIISIWVNFDMHIYKAKTIRLHFYLRLLFTLNNRHSWFPFIFSFLINLLSALFGNKDHSHGYNICIFSLPLSPFWFIRVCVCFFILNFSTLWQWLFVYSFLDIPLSSYVCTNLNMNLPLNNRLCSDLSRPPIPLHRNKIKIETKISV